MYKFQGIWSQFQLKVFQFCLMFLFTDNALKKKKTRISIFLKTDEKNLKTVCIHI